MGDNTSSEAKGPGGTGRVALVTGGAIRVGRAIAHRLADQGFDVAITYRGSAAEANGTIHELREKGGRAEALQADLSDMDQAAMVPPRVAEALGRLDVVVNSASVFYRTPIGGVTEDEWDDLFAVNAKGPFFLTQAAVPYLKHDDANVVNVLDTSTERPFPGYVPYCASKAALEAVTTGLARALAPKVRVNGVAPGPVLPPDGYDEAARQRSADTTLLGRWGAPDDVADAVAFLATNGYVTGSVIPVDGGRRAK